MALIKTRWKDIEVGEEVQKQIRWIVGSPNGQRWRQAGLQHLKNVSDYKLGTYQSPKTLWHYIFAESSA